MPGELLLLIDEKQVGILEALSMDAPTSYKRARLRRHIDNEFLEKGFIRDYRIRDAYTKKYGFVVFGSELFQIMKKYEPLVSIGAGCGYLEQCAIDNGVDIVVTDIGGNNLADNPYKFSNLYGNIEKLEALQAIEKYSDRNIFLSWPHGWEEEMLNQVPVGKIVLLISEGYGGCCASEESWGILNSKYKELTERNPIISFTAVHDYLSVHQKTSI